jgi:predicted metal-dependent phosphoesterase TrpH
MKVDLHVHTNYSSCSILKIDTLKKLCKKFDIYPAITDHNVIAGAKKFKNCILGEEIMTKEGEIIGLFLNGQIKKGLSIEETIDKIKEQGGIVYVPHPFDWRRRSQVKRTNFKMDMIEVFNGRIWQQSLNEKAKEFAKKNKITMGVGSDTHTPFELGRIYNEIEEFNSPKEFLKNMKKAKLVTCNQGVLTQFRVNVISGTRKWILKPLKIV